MAISRHPGPGSTGFPRELTVPPIPGMLAWFLPGLILLVIGFLGSSSGLLYILKNQHFFDGDYPLFLGIFGFFMPNVDRITCH